MRSTRPAWMLPRPELAAVRAMTNAERDAALICRRCWEFYRDCRCGEKQIREECSGRA